MNKDKKRYIIVLHGHTGMYVVDEFLYKEDADKMCYEDNMRSLLKYEVCDIGELELDEFMCNKRQMQ